LKQSIEGSAATPFITLGHSKLCPKFIASMHACSRRRWCVQAKPM
jgi:hypothetical protein